MYLAAPKGSSSAASLARKDGPRAWPGLAVAPRPFLPSGRGGTLRWFGADGQGLDPRPCSRNENLLHRWGATLRHDGAGCCLAAAPRHLLLGAQGAALLFPPAARLDARARSHGLPARLFPAL